MQGGHGKRRGQEVDDEIRIRSAFSDDETDQDSETPGSDSEDSEDNVPLAQRIPGALQAQKTIRTQERNERERRRKEKHFVKQKPRAVRAIVRLFIRLLIPVSSSCVIPNRLPSRSSLKSFCGNMFLHLHPHPHQPHCAQRILCAVQPNLELLPHSLDTSCKAQVKWKICPKTQRLYFLLFSKVLPGHATNL